MENHPYKTITAMTVFGNISSLCWDRLERRLFAGAMGINNPLYGLIKETIQDPVQLLHDDLSITIRESVNRERLSEG